MEYNTKTSIGRPLRVVKQKDDPMGALRVSLGGTEEVGYYLVFRGDISKVAKMIDEAKEAIHKAETQHFTQNN